MRAEGTRGLVCALLIGVSAHWSCGSAHHVGGDGDGDGDTDADCDSDTDADDDVDGDTDASSDADHSRESDIEGPDDVPRCGDGVLDPEEECDDRNRLNGDGCDWLCRLGDGEPPPEPDPSFVPYGYEGAPISVNGRTDGMGSLRRRLPLVWTGSELATAFLGQSDVDGSRVIFFCRYDELGTMLDAEQEVPMSVGPGGLDLVWTGGGYALFYTQGWEGVFMLRMDPSGWPVSEPVRVVEDPCAREPGADFAGPGHALSWSVTSYGDDDDPCHGEGLNPDAGVHVALLADDGSGSRIAGPLHVLTASAAFSDVAAGPGGLGMTFVQWGDPQPTEDVRFIFIEEDLSEVVTSGVLSRGAEPPSVVFADGQYWAAWIHYDEVDSEDEASEVEELCVARFSTEGVLVAAPVCTAPRGYSGLAGPRIAFGDGGLGIVVGALGPPLFLRTDSAGMVVGEPVEVDPLIGYWLYGPYAIVWADTAFVVLYAGGPDDELRLRRFAERR